MSDLYHDSIYAWPQPVDSYWEANDGAPVRGCDALEGDADCDVAVIGGGYTGLSAALLNLAQLATPHAGVPILLGCQ